MASTTNPSTTNGTTGVEGTSIAKDLGEQYRQLFGDRVITVDANGVPNGEFPLLLVPSGLRVESLKKFADEYRTAPERRRGTAQLRDADSFIAHVQRFMDTDSAVFANPDRGGPSLTAVLDYHEVGTIAAAKARWGTHRAAYAPALSDEWKRWRAIDGKPLGMREFAEFLDANVTDVIAAPSELPDSLRAWSDIVGGRFATPSELVALSRNLQVNVETTIRQALTLDSGEVSVVYAEQHRDGEGSPIRIANLFLIAIPVFFNGVRWPVPVRLRYRPAGNSVQWICQLHRVEETFDRAFTEIVADVKEGTGLPVFYGAPEGDR